MTIQRLEQLVLMLSNFCWCRYWKLYNYPNEPAEFAIQCRLSSGKTTAIIDLLKEPGYIRTDDDFIYIFRKYTNEQPTITRSH